MKGMVWLGMRRVHMQEGVRRRCKSAVQSGRSESEQDKKGQGKEKVIRDWLHIEMDQISDYMKGNRGKVSYC